LVPQFGSVVDAMHAFATRSQSEQLAPEPMYWHSSSSESVHGWCIATRVPPLTVTSLQSLGPSCAHTLPAPGTSVHAPTSFHVPVDQSTGCAPQFASRK